MDILICRAKSGLQVAERSLVGPSARQSNVFHRGYRTKLDSEG